MSKKHNNKNNEVEQKSLNNEEYVIEEEAVEEAAEPEVAEGAATEEQPKAVEGEVVGSKKSCKNHHHKKHHKSNKHHHKKIDGKKVMKKIGNGAVIATYIASVTAVTCQCLTNPISTVGLITKECLELHFEKGENKAREEMLRKKIRAEYENAAVVGPAA